MATAPATRAFARVAFAILFASVVWVAGRDTLLAQAVGAICIVVIFAHAVLAWGWTEALAFAGLCLVTTFVVENIGVRTGFPFGRYVFLVDPQLPRIGAIPLIVGPLYFGFGYPSWIIANLLLGRGVARPAGWFDLAAMPLIATFVMVQWDVVMDPTGATLARAWVWFQSGGYFGVPLSNFLGWFLVNWLYFQAFAVFLFRRRNLSPGPQHTAAFWSVPVLLYLAGGLCHLPPLFDPDVRLVDAGGRVWSAADLRETTVIVMLFTMLTTAFLALLRLWRAALEGSGGAPRLKPVAPPAVG